MPQQQFIGRSKCFLRAARSIVRGVARISGAAHQVNLKIVPVDRRGSGVSANY